MSDSLTPEELPKLPGNQYDTLLCLFVHGPTWDGDVPSKVGRDALVDAGLASRGDGWQWLTEQGHRLAIQYGFHTEKERRDSKRNRELRELRESNKRLEAVALGKVKIQISQASSETPSDHEPDCMPYLCIKPACPETCDQCNHAISPQQMRAYAIAHAMQLRGVVPPVDVRRCKHGVPEGMTCARGGPCCPLNTGSGQT